MSLLVDLTKNTQPPAQTLLPVVDVVAVVVQGMKEHLSSHMLYSNFIILRSLVNGRTFEGCVVSNFSQKKIWNFNFCKIRDPYYIIKMSPSRKGLIC